MHACMHVCMYVIITYIRDSFETWLILDPRWTIPKFPSNPLLQKMARPKLQVVVTPC